MLLIKTPLWAKFRNGESLQCATNELEYYRSSKVQTAFLDKGANELTTHVNTMTAAFMDNKDASVTKQMKPFDDSRIKALRGLRAFLQSEIYRTDAIDNPANTLMKNLSKFNDRIERLSFQHKTAVINKMLSDWQTEPDLTQAVQALPGANTWVEELNQRNQNFHLTYFEKAKNTVSAEQSKTMRKNIVAAHQEWMKDITSLARVNGDNPEFETFIRELNGIIETANAPVANRGSRRKKEVVPEAPPPAPIPTDTVENPFGI